LLHKTLIALAATVALGCVPVTTNAFAAVHSAAHASVGHASVGHASVGHASVGHAMGGRAMAGTARRGHAAGVARGGGRVARYGRGYGRGPVYNGPIYDSCAGYGYGAGYNGCRGNGVPIVGRVIDDVLGGYGPY
jgi:hypothetical protein